MTTEVDPIESLAERVLFIPKSELGEKHHLEVAAALLRAAIEAERAAAVEPFAKVQSAFWAFDATACCDDREGWLSGDCAAWHPLRAAFEDLRSALTSAPSADELVRRVREEALAPFRTPRPRDEWDEDDGNVLWWLLPVTEPPYCGTPLDDEFPGYVTHWTPLVEPLPSAKEPTDEKA